ncbi:MAG: hypothetical protein GX227_02930 [Clostridiaceae bacterium]|jgi:hypothetical protein|nr:hypothetical protein [Clostridiaceae bacterium]
MKQNLTIEDLNSLTFSQKQTINSLWLPAKYDQAVASVCKDAENDIYEDLEFVVGEVILSHGTTLTLKRLRMPEDFIVVDEEQILDEQESLEEVFYDHTDPGDYFLKDNCLPLLNIGQLIEMIRKTKSGQDGFSLMIPPTSGFESEQGFSINDRFGEVDRDNELIDLLFKILKEQL